MNDIRSDIVNEAMKYLNVPFRHRGRSMLGIDCVGLIIKAYQRTRIIESPKYEPYGPLWWRNDDKREILLETFENNGFIMIRNPLRGDIIAVRKQGPKYPVCHAGLLADDNVEFMIHAKCSRCRNGKQVVMEQVDVRFYDVGVYFLRHENLMDKD